jgi:RNA polymerase sigma factor (sigma-70 family)
MANGQVQAVINQMRKLVGRQNALSDGQLVQDFVQLRDEAAFEVLIWRHATMVLNLCQRILHDSHEAEDAFQASFLILARKGASIGKHESVASWLYKVAYRVALRVRSKSIVRSGTEGLVEQLAAPETGDDLLWRDLRPVLDEEINRLPEKYRAPFVLCYLEGQTNEQAAEQLGCPKGTILSRLSRGREWLRNRLVRRGIALSAASLATLLTANAASAGTLSASVISRGLEESLVSSTVKAALPFATGNPVTGLISASVKFYTEGVLHAMYMTKLKFAAGALMVLGLVGSGTGLLIQQAQAQREPVRGKEAAAPERGERGERGPREVPKGTLVSGKVTEVAKDGKGITIELPAEVRGEEPKKVEFKFDDKTALSFSGVGPDGAKPTVGQIAHVRLEKGEKDPPASVAFMGTEMFGRTRPAYASEIIGVTADGKGITLGTASRRGEEAKRIEIRLTDKTQIYFSNVGEGGAAFKEGQHAEVWVSDGPMGSNAERVAVRGTESVEVRGGPNADVVGKVVAFEKKMVTVETAAAGRGEESKKVEIKLDENSKIAYNAVGLNLTKIVVGMQARIWLEGSKDTAARATFTGEVKERHTTLTGKVVDASGDGKSITVEVQAGRGRGEEPKRTEIKITDKSRVAYFGVKLNEAKPAKDYHVQVILEEGSNDTAKEVMFQGGAGQVVGRR